MSLVSLIEPHLSLPSADDCQRSQRVFHGRGHAYQALSHINIDSYHQLLIITLYSEVELSQLEALSDTLLQKMPWLTHIQAQKRYLRHGEFIVLASPDGQMIEHWRAQENDLHYQLNFGQQRNTGIFLDIANARHWLQDNSDKKFVLNLFSYTCAFSVAAIAGGADKVVNIDMSKASLSQGRHNHKINDQDLAKVKFEGVDIFKSFGRIKKHGPYDVVVCDPPSFQKGSVDIKKDYSKIIRRLPQFVNDGADIMLCLNSPDLSEQFLLHQVAEHCPQCVYRGRIDNPEVFKEAEQGKGLKVLMFKYFAD